MVKGLKALLVTLLVALTTTAAAQAHHGGTPPPPPPPPPPAPATLTGELLHSVNNPDFPGGTGTAQVTTDCNADGTGTIRYRITGTATGPYPGTFTEVGLIELGQPVKVPPTGAFPAVYSVTAFMAMFQIQSGNFTITGTK